MTEINNLSTAFIAALAEHVNACAGKIVDAGDSYLVVKSGAQGSSLCENFVIQASSKGVFVVVENNNVPAIQQAYPFHTHCEILPLKQALHDFASMTQLGLNPEKILTGLDLG